MGIRVEELRRKKVFSFSSESNTMWTRQENDELNALLELLGEEEESQYEINMEPAIDYLKRNGIKPSPLLTEEVETAGKMENLRSYLKKARNWLESC